MVRSKDGKVRVWDLITGVKTEDGKIVEEFTPDAVMTIRDGEVVSLVETSTKGKLSHGF